MKTSEAYERAKIEADESFPYPNDSAGITATRYGIFAILCFFSFEIFLPLVGLWWSEAITVAIAALIGWADSTRRIRAHSRAFSELYHVYSDHSKREE